MTQTGNIYHDLSTGGSIIEWIIQYDTVSE